MKKFLSGLICLGMILAMLPFAALANGAQEVVIAQTTSTFATEQEAFDGDIVTFRAVSDGTVTVQISDCSPGYYIEVYEGSNWVSDYYDAVAETVTLNVTSGMSYELIISSYDMEEECQAPGFITYKITSAVVTTEEDTSDSTLPTDEGGSSESNPLQIEQFHSMYIEAGRTVWFVYNGGSGTKVLHINGRTTYSVCYNGQDVPVDQDGYVNYQMEDVSQQGSYLFSVTNNGAYQVYFTISVTDRPDYINTGVKLEIGVNDLTLDAQAANSLYEFTPDQTGEYLFTVSDGVIGNWGTSFNPVDCTVEKGTSLSWTCTSVGQSVLVGVTGADGLTLTVARTADYVAQTEIPWVFYEYTYDFSYEIPFDAVIVDIDVTDSVEDIAVLDQNGFYRYGSAYGPLMVADLSNVEINILDASNYGQLRAYVYDENGVLVERIDYNEAMYEYASYGMTPVTEELAAMIKQVGDTQSWWVPGGFVFQDTSPLNEDSAWMAFCSYIEGSELDEALNNTGNNNVTQDNGAADIPENNNQSNEDDQGSNGSQGNNDTTNENNGSSANNSVGGSTVSGSDSHSNPTVGNTGGSPGTDDLSMAGIICVMLVSVAGLVALVQRRKRII